MAGLRLAPLALLLATACSIPGAAPDDQTLSAAGAAVAEQVVSTTSTTIAPVTTTVAPPTTTLRTTTTSKPTTTTRRPPATATPPIAGYSPAPPPPGVAPDGYGGYGGLTTATSLDTTVTLTVYPREQYLGEDFQVGAAGQSTGIVKSIVIDFGDGQVIRPTVPSGVPCATEPRPFGDGRRKVYAAPGTYRITVTVTIAPCVLLTAPAGSLGGDLKPIPADVTFLGESAPTHTVSASMDVLQRPDRPPRPVGPPPGP